MSNWIIFTRILTIFVISIIFAIIAIIMYNCNRTKTLTIDDKQSTKNFFDNTHYIGLGKWTPSVNYSIHNVLNNGPDPIRNYDYHKTFDPFEQPVRRVPRHELPNYYFKRMIDIPTRGYPDNFTQIGILVKQGDPNENVENKILRLFGRQEYPRSYKYEYYTMLNSGLDRIKIPVKNKRKELYDDDVIFIPELKEHYRVQLHKYDEPKYYPDLVF